MQTQVEPQPHCINGVESTHLCIRCRQPLPAKHRSTRRYCSGSCRTLAYNLRAEQGQVQKRGEPRPQLPAGLDDPFGDLPLLSTTRHTLGSVSGTLASVLRQFEADELALRRR